MFDSQNTSAVEPSTQPHNGGAEAGGAIDRAADDDEQMRAARELSDAFATIEQYRDYLPASVYNPLAEAMMDWIVTDSQWMRDPRMVRAGMPGILREIFAKEELEEEMA